MTLNPKKCEDNFYSLECSFARHALERPDGRRKAQLFGALIPAGCASILDVGGGTGWSTVDVRRKCAVTTLDRTLASLLTGRGDRVLADAGYLPFRDRSFDLVLSSELLEHLAEPVFEKVRTEMARAAAKFLMISVPYRENLRARMVRCGYCGEVFHTDYHVRAFREQDLAVLFSGWTLGEWHVFGVLDEHAGTVSVSTFLRGDRRTPIASEYTICPSCGRQGRAAGKHSARISKLRRLVQRLTTIARGRTPTLPDLLRCNQDFLPQGKAPYWVAALYMPHGSAMTIDGHVDNTALA